MVNMFGKEYAKHLDVLIASFREINSRYQKKVKNNSNISFFKKIYIMLFGIPEIGFQIRSMYLKKILASNLLNKNLKKILDAGSGIGAYTFLLGQTYPQAKVTGGDIDKYKLKSCQTMAKELGLRNIEFIYMDATRLGKRTIYDFIVSIDVLEHINHYELALENFSNLLRKGGYLYIHAPQPNQKRLFKSLGEWHHENHVHEGIIKREFEEKLKKLGFKIVVSKETFGFFGKLAWEINHLTLSKSFFIAGLIYPLLNIIASLDLWQNNKNGLGIAVLAKKE